jgi:hypothetical protein
LILAQELAADELAASALGSRREYLRALTRLALRHDAHPTDGSVAALVPVFSGFLLRRIDMLRAKDCSTNRKSRPIMQWTAIALLALTAAATAALRGLEQPPETQADGSVRVANANDARRKPAAAADAQPEVAGLFQRPPFDLSLITLNKKGGFLLRLGELLATRELSEQARALNESFVAGWKDAFPTAEAPSWSLSDIEYIAGDFQLTFRRNEHPQENDHPDQVMFGATCAVIRWQKPLDGQIDALRRIPGAEQKSHGDVQYVELPLIPALGPIKPCVCRLDERTLLFAFSEDFLRKQLEKLAATQSPPDWHKAWESVEGGLITVVAVPNIVHPLSAPDDPQWRQRSHELITSAKLYAVGVDWQGASAGVFTIKCQIECDTHEGASLVQGAIRELIAKATEDLRTAPDTDEAKAKAAKQMMQALLRDAKVETRQVDGRWQVDAQFTGPPDIQSIWEHL